VQGYLTGKPMPPHVAIAALNDDRYEALMPAELRS
jgi:hypothetical protein